MLKLYAVLLGGRAEGCNTELHDVVFIVASKLEESYQQLAKKWFGSKKRLHIDSSIELTQVDGYDVTIRKEKPAHDNKIFFVNFGGYVPGKFGEQHEIAFYVGQSKPETLARAKTELCLGMSEQHCDDNVDIDDVIEFNQVDEYYIHLTPAAQKQPLDVQSYYRKIILPEQAA